MLYTSNQGKDLNGYISVFKRRASELEPFDLEILDVKCLFLKKTLTRRSHFVSFKPESHFIRECV